MTIRYLLPALLICILFTQCTPAETEVPKILPKPNAITAERGAFDLSSGFNVKIANPDHQALSNIIEQDFYLLTGKRNIGKNSNISLEFKLDENLDKEAYSIEIDNQISITGGSYAALTMGLTSLWQSMDSNGKVPRFTLTDQPEYAYRSIMLDIARAWHEPETIKEIIDLCRWYKINYLHLHLTDDSAFSFPSDTYPSLATEGHSYTKTTLIELNKYAYDRGVILVPEIDVPGHSSEFIRKMPELFGIQKVADNPYTVSMAREDTYAALATIFKEVAAIFTHSPYIHIGGDEAFFEGMEKDPATVAYMKKYDLPNLHELFRHFLIRMNDNVKAAGKQTVLWAGFGEHGKLEIPRDMIVMLWEPIYHHPNRLLEEGFSIINASFKPLYVVNNRKWAPEYIYTFWNPNRWESWTNTQDTTFVGIEIPKNEQVLGATMCAWEQSQINQMPRLRSRIPGMSERLWSASRVSEWDRFAERQLKKDKRLSSLIRPFEVKLGGLTFPELDEGNFYEHLWFSDELTIAVAPNFNGLTFKYNTAKNPGEGTWEKMEDAIELSETSHVRIQAFDAFGEKVGRTYYQRFFLKPIIVKTEGLWKDLPSGSWDKLRFEDTLLITLTTKKQGYTLRYVTNGRAVTDTSEIYTAPIPLTKTTHFRAQLFDQEGKAFGSSFGESYFKLWQVKSLTTDKKVWASTEELRPGLGARANNGRVTLWDQWGDHKSEENWVQVDLGKVEDIARFKVFTFWDNYRYYQYNIEGSVDGENWKELVDFSENTLMADSDGYAHEITPVKARFLKINMLFNSANPGLHIIEFCAWGAEQ